VFNAPDGGFPREWSPTNFYRKVMDGQVFKWRGNIVENFYCLSRAHKRYRRQTDRPSKIGIETSGDRSPERSRDLASLMATLNEQSPISQNRVDSTISRWQKQECRLCSASASSVSCWVHCNNADMLNFDNCYRVACNTDAVYRWELCPAVRLSVCLSNACIVTKR